MKHWTEPNGIFLIQIPTGWQYLNSVVEGEEEKSTFSFQPYENANGCFHDRLRRLMRQALIGESLISFS